MTIGYHDAKNKIFRSSCDKTRYNIRLEMKNDNEIADAIFFLSPTENADPYQF